MPETRYLHLLRQDCPLPQGAHVIAYCRDSGGEEQDRSVQQQIEAIQEYCEAHQLILERIYRDEARAGSNTDKRDELKLMQADITERFRQIHDMYKRKKYMDKHPFGLIIWKMNRLGRDAVETTFIKSDFRLRGVTMIPLIASIETGDVSMNALFEVVQQYQDEQLLQEIADNSRRGLAELVSLRDTDVEFRMYNPDWPTQDGRYLGILPGPAPTGFKREPILVGVRERRGRKVGGEKHIVHRLVPNEDHQVWERCYFAWKMRHEGAPIKKILEATRLYKNVSGYDHFFENPIYIGELHYGGQVLKNFVPALIPEDWFKEEQVRREARAAKHQRRTSDPLYEPRRVGSRHLLTGLVFCGAVDGQEHPMNADTVPERKGKRSRWDFYICSHKKNSRETTCQAARVGAAALDEAVVNSLMTHVLTRDNLRPIADAMAEVLMERNQGVTMRIASVQGQLEAVQETIRNLIDAMEKGGFSKHIHVRLQERESEERKLIAELVNLQDLIVEAEDLPAVTDAQLDDWIESMRTALQSEDLDVARRAIRQFVAKIVVKAKAGTIYYTFPLSHLSRLREMTLMVLQSN